MGFVAVRGRVVFSSNRFGVACFLVKHQLFSSSLIRRQRSKDLNASFKYKGKNSISSALQVMGNYPVECDLRLLACFTLRRVNSSSVVSCASRQYSHFHQHSCSGGVPSGSLISGLILSRAPCLATDLRGWQAHGPARLTTIIGDCGMTLIKVIDV